MGIEREARPFHPDREHTSKYDLRSKCFGLELVTTKLRPVPTVAPHANVHTAVYLVSNGGVGSVVPVENGAPVGIITERDILKLALYDPMSYHLRDVMSSPLITIDPQEHLGKALRIMSERNIRHLPIVERGKLVGILTDREILRWVMESHDDLLTLVAMDARANARNLAPVSEAK